MDSVKFAWWFLIYILSGRFIGLLKSFLGWNLGTGRHYRIMCDFFARKAWSCVFISWSLLIEQGWQSIPFITSCVSCAHVRGTWEVDVHCMVTALETKRTACTSLVATNFVRNIFVVGLFTYRRACVRVRACLHLRARVGVRASDWEWERLHGLRKCAKFSPNYVHSPYLSL
jgi:hypothetical protein